MVNSSLAALWALFVKPQRPIKGDNSKGLAVFRGSYPKFLRDHTKFWKKVRINLTTILGV